MLNFCFIILLCFVVIVVVIVVFVPAVPLFNSDLTKMFECLCELRSMSGLDYSRFALCVSFSDFIILLLLLLIGILMVHLL